MSKSKLKVVVIAVLLGVLSFTGLNQGNIQADELKSKQVVLAKEIIKSIKYQADIKTELEIIKNKESSDSDALNIDLTLEMTFQKTLENLEIELIKDKLEFELVNKQILSVGDTAELPYLGDGSYTWPVEDYFNVSQYYGATHKGIDINTLGAHPNVVAVQTGIVVKAINDGDGFGNKVVVYQGDNTYTLYAHLQTMKVQVGQYIEEGKIIGLVGHTGNSTGDHLHIQMTKSGNVENNTIDPYEYIKIVENK
ncbi:MAG: M23 family metallopeptidase [Firmicutes bacterium]|nr:M23 family metallopeptidase [Bacillota bacterium]